jgi:Transposase DDE domain
VRHPTEGVRALPVRAELYVRAKDGTAELAAQGWRFRTKLELAGQQLAWLHTWAGRAAGPVCVVADGAYAKRPVLRVVRRLGMTTASRLAKNAAPWGLPPARRRKGQRGPLPTYGKARVDRAKRAGQRRGRPEVACVPYGAARVKRVKTFRATWRPAGGMIRVVLVMERDGGRAYFSTGVNMTAREVLERAADRGAIEQTFKDVKEVWGAGQQQVRDVHASVGAFDINGWMYTAVEAWAWQRPHEQLGDRRACPWDEAGRRPSHQDKRQALQREAWRAETQAALAGGPGGEGFRRLLARLLDFAT